MTTQSSDPVSTSRSTLPVLRSGIGVVALAVLLAVGLAAPVQAQSRTSGPADRPEAEQGQWKAHFGTQIGRTLREEPAGPVRTALLHTLIDVAAERGAAIDFSAAIPALLHIVETDADPERRLLALQALDVIGPYRTGTEVDRYRSAMVRLYDLVQKDSSLAVRRAGASLLTGMWDGKVS